MSPWAWIDDDVFGDTRSLILMELIVAVKFRAAIGNEFDHQVSRAIETILGKATKMLPPDEKNVRLARGLRGTDQHLEGCDNDLTQAEAAHIAVHQTAQEEQQFLMQELGRRRDNDLPIDSFRVGILIRPGQEFLVTHPQPLVGCWRRLLNLLRHCPFLPASPHSWRYTPRS